MGGKKDDFEEYLRAANYLTAAQIFLQDNFLLERPLEFDDIAVITVFIIKNNLSAPAVTDKPEQQTAQLKTYDACQLLTEQKAKTLLGSAILSEESTPQSSEDLKVSNCNYNNVPATFAILSVHQPWCVRH
jgi:hypothetical protein